jgi:RNA polymerase sigma factor (sigma-70 family)
MNDGEMERCIARAAGGDTDALHSLYDALRCAVFALALAVTRDRQLAEDVLQDVFVQVYAGAGSYRGGKPRAWIMRIARNRAISVLRKRKHELPLPEPAPGENAAAAPELSEAPDLEAALAALDGRDREIVVLSAVAELTNREIAGVLGMPQGSVSWRYRRAMSELRERLAERKDRHASNQ